MATDSAWGPLNAVARARDAVRIEPAVQYSLGTGGRRPYAPTPANDLGFCDCSGFLAWCLRIDRKTAGGLWWNTDSIESDALRPGGSWTRIGLPVPGCAVVYGAGPKVGHCGLVTVADARDVLVVDCASRRVRAILERGVKPFLSKGGIYVWYHGLGPIPSLTKPLT